MPTAMVRPLLLLVLLLLAVLVAAGAAAATNTLEGTFSWKKQETLRNAFLLLDHNADGRVTLAEAAAGLSALHDPEQRALRSAREPTVALSRHIDDNLCVPSTEPVAFVDCVSSRARRMAAQGKSPSTVMQLQAELDDLYGGFDDDLPIGAAEHTCDELVDAHSADCRELLRQGYCRLSCGHHAQHYFESKGLSAAVASAKRRRAQTAPDLSDFNGYARVLLSSDWHLEPWYDTTGTGHVDGDIRTSRFIFSDATLGSFGTCRAGTNASAVVEPACPTTSMHDPPLAFGRSHFEAFAATFPDCCFRTSSVANDQQNASRVGTSAGRVGADVARGALFMLGDGQAHGFHRPYFSLSNADAVGTHARTLLKMAKESFAVDRIFWTPGNNDGPHSSIFVHHSRDSVAEEQQIVAESVAWADALIEEDIVTDALPRQYEFVLEAAPDCVDDAEGLLQSSNSSCAAVIGAIADMFVSDGYDACDCSIEAHEGMGHSGCAVGKTTNPLETIECACHRPIDDPEERAHMTNGVSVSVDTAPSLETAATGWRQPRRCLAPGGDGEGCVQLVEICPAFCNDCFVPPVEMHETHLSPTAFFRRTGYYLKQLDPNNAMGLRGANLYVIVLNTNLGAANAQQTAALLKDLSWVQQRRGGVYLLGHHPHVMANPALVPEEYLGTVLGRFAGHVHFAASTDELLFTQVSSISQAGETSFSVMTIGNSPEQQHSMPAQAGRIGSREQLIPAVRLERDVFSWFGGPGSANEPSLWKVLPTSSVEQRQQLQADNVNVTTSTDGTSDGVLRLFAVAVVVTFSLAIAGFTLVFRRQELAKKLENAREKGKSEASIYELSENSGSRVSATTEQNPI